MWGWNIFSAAAHKHKHTHLAHIQSFWNHFFSSFPKRLFHSDFPLFVRSSIFLHFATYLQCHAIKSANKWARVHERWHRKACIQTNRTKETHIHYSGESDSMYNGMEHDHVSHASHCDGAEKEQKKQSEFMTTRLVNPYTQWTQHNMPKVGYIRFYDHCVEHSIVKGRVTGQGQWVERSKENDGRASWIEKQKRSSSLL